MSEQNDDAKKSMIEVTVTIGYPSGYGMTIKYDDNSIPEVLRAAFDGGEFPVPPAAGGESPLEGLSWKTADGEEYTYTPEHPMPDYSWLEARQLAFELDDAKKKLANAESLAEFYNTENDKLCGLVATVSRSLSEEREMRETAEDDVAKNANAVKVLSSSVDNLVRQRDALRDTIENMKVRNAKATQDRDAALSELSRIHSNDECLQKRWENLDRLHSNQVVTIKARDAEIGELKKGITDLQKKAAAAIHQADLWYAAHNAVSKAHSELVEEHARLKRVYSNGTE